MKYIYLFREREVREIREQVKILIDYLYHINLEFAVKKIVTIRDDILTILYCKKQKNA